MTDIRFDSVLFDMDGTLWDAVDSYAEIWNHTLRRMGLSHPEVTREQLLALMGMPIHDIMRKLLPDLEIGAETFLEALDHDEGEMMPVLGGRLYAEVRHTLETLRRRGLRLFMVSNCGEKGLPNFLRYTGLEDLVEGHLSYGQTGQEKDVNIRTVVTRYNLTAPVYVGDTAGDLRCSHAAGVPFVWAAYGFGKAVVGADAGIQDISALPGVLEQL